MRIVLTKVSDERHTLEIIRSDETRESVELVTREALFHDLLHYAVESCLPSARGFWGTLAAGKTIADLNDRSGAAVKDNAEELYRVEGIVGVMTGVTGMSTDAAFERLRWLCESQNQALPNWCTPAFVTDVFEIIRRLQGRWKATPYGESMEFEWSGERPAA